MTDNFSCCCGYCDAIKGELILLPAHVPCGYFVPFLLPYKLLNTTQNPITLYSWCKQRGSNEELSVLQCNTFSYTFSSFASEAPLER